jgi:broad specificity phosphatase PhoE
MSVFLVRHLPTAWSRAGRLQGRRDIGILCPDESEAGRIRANRLRLQKAGPFRSVFVSTLRRSKETARAYGYERALVEPLLDELDFGPYEGRLRSDMERQIGRAWFTNPAAVRLGEPLVDLEGRARAFIASHCSERGPILVFGHGAWIRAFISVAVQGNVRAMNRTTVQSNEIHELVRTETDDFCLASRRQLGEEVV